MLCLYCFQLRPVKHLLLLFDGNNTLVLVQQVPAVCMFRLRQRQRSMKRSDVLFQLSWHQHLFLDLSLEFSLGFCFWFQFQGDWYNLVLKLADDAFQVLDISVRMGGCWNGLLLWSRCLLVVVVDSVALDFERRQSGLRIASFRRRTHEPCKFLNVSLVLLLQMHLANLIFPLQKRRLKLLNRHLVPLHFFPQFLRLF